MSPATLGPVQVRYRAEIAEAPADDWSGAGFTVTAFAEGVSVHRPEMQGWRLGPNRKLAERLARAIEAGAVFGPAEIRRDIHGDTYVSAPSRVLARMMNADLRRLGF